MINLELYAPEANSTGGRPRLAASIPVRGAYLRRVGRTDD